jgi:ABC-type oligopeptide transport system substrate-binding subunit
MKRFFILALAIVLASLSLTGCWTARYDTASDSNYYWYPSNPNLDYINSLAPTSETPVTPSGK